MHYRQETLNRVCDYRGLPKIKIGTECEIDGRRGIIIGGNSSANLSVIFDGDSTVMNCHPYFKARIFNDAGELSFKSSDHYDRT